MQIITKSIDKLAALERMLQKCTDAADLLVLGDGFNQEAISSHSEVLIKGDNKGGGKQAVELRIRPIVPVDVMHGLIVKKISELQAEIGTLKPIIEMSAKLFETLKAK